MDIAKGRRGWLQENGRRMSPSIPTPSISTTACSPRTTRKIAKSLKRSAEHNYRRKGAPLQSAMSMLTFYINRVGDNLSKTRLEILEKAKDELRALFDEP